MIIILLNLYSGTIGDNNMINKLTEEQVLEMFKDATVKFSSYYKYNFSYRGKIIFDNITYEIYCSYGGDKDSIYRYTVDCDKDIPFITKDYNGKLKFGTTDGEWDYLTISKDNVDIFVRDSGW